MLRINSLACFLVFFLALNANAENITVTPIDEIIFKNENNLDIAYDKENKLFSGATVLLDDDERNITYFYRNGKKNGVAFSRFEDGKMELEITYKKGLKNGDEILFYENGQPKYKKTYVNNVLNGEEVLFFDNGKPMQISSYKNGVLEGEVSYYDKDGNRTKIETYKAGLKNGKEHIIANNTLKEENFYENGVLHGLTKKFNEKYLIEEIEYKNGQKNGIDKIYKADGSWIEIPYKNNQKTGEAFAYYPNKKIANRAFYLNDLKNGKSEKIYQNGIIKLSENFKNDKLDGVARLFDDKGNLSKVSYYVDGIELAKIEISQDVELNELYEAYKKNQLGKFLQRKNLWYPILWLAINTEKTDMLNDLEKSMKMYAAKIDDFKTFKRESKLKFNEYNRKLFFGLTPLSYAINISAPVEILQKFATTNENIEEVSPRGTTALLEAVRLNDLKLVEYLLTNKADVQKQYDNGNTILLYAIKEKTQPKIVKKLLDKGANVEATDDKNFTPLMLAIKNNDLQLIKILAEYNANFSKGLPNGESLFSYAFDLQVNDEILQLFLNKGFDANVPDTEGNLWLIKFLKLKNIKMAKIVLDNNADVNAVDASGYSAVSYIVENPFDAELFETILQKNKNFVENLPNLNKPLWKVFAEQEKFDLLKQNIISMGGVDVVDSNGESPLIFVMNNSQNTKLFEEIFSMIDKKLIDSKPYLMWMAVENKNLNLFKRYINLGANVNIIRDDGDSLLTYLVREQYPLEYIEAIENGELDINFVAFDDKDALGLAVLNNNVQTALNLINHGANVKRVDNNKNSYLMNLTFENAEITDLLLQNGADISLVPNEKISMLMYAVKNLNEKLVDYLIAQNVDINVMDENDNNALMYIAESAKKYDTLSADDFINKALPIVEKLKNSGFDLNLQNSSGETLAILVAKSNKAFGQALLPKLIELGYNQNLKDQYGKTAQKYLDN